MSFLGASDRVPVLLDTDIGSDIDDAVALAYLLGQPRCELVGITVVTGDVQKRAALAEVVCRAAGRFDVPIHLGRREPLAYGPGQPLVPQYDVIADEPHRLNRPENTAVEYLRETIRARPGEITLLSIGPYSNLALLFALDPEIPFLLKGLVSMGGAFYSGTKREWNAVCDPMATALVYASERRNHLTVGLDVTERCRMTASEVRRRFTGEPLETVARLAEKWFKHHSQLTFHDPLAAALLFRPGLCAEEPGRVRAMISADPNEYGHLHLEPGRGPDRVARKVDHRKFFDEYFSVTKGVPLGEFAEPGPPVREEDQMRDRLREGTGAASLPAG